jgi:hypothetical protein
MKANIVYVRFEKVKIFSVSNDSVDVFDSNILRAKIIDTASPSNSLKGALVHCTVLLIDA